MPDQPIDPSSDKDDWLRAFEASGDEPPSADDPVPLAIVIEAMRKTGDALRPSEETRRSTWQQIMQSMESQSPPVKSRTLSLLQRFWGMPVFAPALVASGVVLTVGLLVWTMQTQDAGITVVAMRGGAHRITVQDVSAQQPKPVQELREMGLDVELQRDAEQILLTIQVSDPPPPALLAWAARWGIPPMPGSKWHILLVPPSSSSQGGRE